MSSRGFDCSSPSCAVMYSNSSMRAVNATSLIIPTPGSMWNIVSIRWCTWARSASGTPSSEEITIDGRTAPKSCT